MSPFGGTGAPWAFVGSCGPTTNEWMIMTYEISALIAQSTSLAEILSGAYGYLSAAVDEYLHTDNVHVDTLHADFHRLQNEVTKGLQLHFEREGVTLAEAARGIGQVAKAMDLPPEHVDKVVHQALKLVWPTTPVTET